MMSDFISILSEYISIILCLHMLARVKQEINIFNIILGIIDVGLLLPMEKYNGRNIPTVLIIYLIFLVYVKVKLVNKWWQALKIWGFMMLVIPSLQLGAYFILRGCFKSRIDYIDISIIANIILCFLFGFWKERVFKSFISIVKRRIWIILITVFIATTLYLYLIYKVDKYVEADIVMQTVTVIWGLIFVIALLLFAEIEKKGKEREIRLYQVYNESFEDAIITIRQRQHEFANHINALKDMQYTIQDAKELIEERNRYCDSLLKENELNSLLKRDLEPIIISVLYTKLLAAQDVGIEVSQKVHVIDFKRRIEIVELVEIIGILIDNAVEALMTEQQVAKKLRVRILSEADKHFSIEVANTCEVLLQSEIEKFAENGYSTKGTNRGMGLARLMEIKKWNNAEISMGNTMYEGHNYFSVKVFI